MTKRLSMEILALSFYLSAVKAQLIAVYRMPQSQQIQGQGLELEFFTIVSNSE